ncbi:MAG TPA: four helix bundle protein [Candidatus Peribacteraceae bacterium]|nr:four helix bundle protein [Candidatus Peribacteraceae bacterium]
MKKQYESLVVWKEAHQLCQKIYKLLPQYPADERFCLVQQMRRSATSVPINIVEGNVKRSRKEKLYYIEIAEGSLDELDYQLLLSKDLGFISAKQCEEMRNSLNKLSYLLDKFRKGIQAAP